MLRCVDGAGDPRMIGRAGGDDHEGLLDIGETSNLRNRFQEILETIKPSTTRSEHSAIWRYVAFGCDRKFPSANLQFQYGESDTWTDAKREEFQLVMWYIERFLEPSPLNSVYVPNGGYPPDYLEIMTSTFGRKPLKPW